MLLIAAALELSDGKNFQLLEFFTHSVAVLHFVFGVFMSSPTDIVVFMFDYFFSSVHKFNETSYTH